MRTAVLRQAFAFGRRDTGLWVLVALWTGACLLALVGTSPIAVDTARNHDVVYLLAFIPSAWGGAVSLLTMRALGGLQPRNLRFPALVTELGVFLAATALFAALPLALLLIEGRPPQSAWMPHAVPALIPVFGAWVVCLRLPVAPRVAVFVFLAAIVLARILPEPRGWFSLDGPLHPWILPMLGIALARWLWSPARTNTR
jgi:hypothetical protein